MHVFCLGALAAAVLLAVCGCRSAEGADAAPTPRQFSDADAAAAEQLGNDYMQALASALRARDFELLAPQLPFSGVELRDRRSTFSRMCASLERFGELKDFRRLGWLDQSLARDQVWVLVFEKATPSDTLPVLHTELLYLIRIMRNDTELEIVKTGFRFL